ncbi:MAG: formimidoylglutamase [Balneolales bacterium]|nr:formimidoylglutamase [Balneolales bacterium]
MQKNNFKNIYQLSAISNDKRIGDLIYDDSKVKRIALAGFCCDVGVVRNGGRAGAAFAPDYIRKALFKMTPDPVSGDAFSDLMASVEDDGNIIVDGNNMEVAQELLGSWVGRQLEKGILPIILGGGHETSFGHFLGYAATGSKVSILNWDAHADIRENKNSKGHSGSPFRQALEHQSGLCQSYTVAGLKRHSISRVHLDYLEGLVNKQRGGYYFKGELNRRVIDHIYERQQGPVMVTMDLDTLSQQLAPGVSAPNPDGLDLGLWLHAAYCAGKSPKVVSLDLVEMNPKFDTDNHTARIAALTLWHFFRGITERDKQNK